MSPVAFGSAALAYFKARGIDAELAARVGVHEEAGTIVWPTVDADGHPSPRCRALNGSGPKVRGAAGASLGVWWPAGPPEPDGAVLLCEGESDALAALSALEGEDVGGRRRCTLRAARRRSRGGDARHELSPRPARRRDAHRSCERGGDRV